jgi:DNA-binding PadR family transcriptional regulator
MSHGHWFEFGWGPPWKAARHHRRGMWPPPPPPPGGPPGPPPWFFDFFAPPPARAERGEVRWLILDTLRDEPRHGYDIIRIIEERSAKSYRPSPGTVYPTLQMLEEMGLCRAVDRDGKKAYEITDAGRAELEEHKDDVEDAYARFNEASPHEAARELRELARWLERLMRVVARSVKHGGIAPRKRQQIEEVVRKAASEIEEILRSER